MQYSPSRAWVALTSAAALATISPAQTFAEANRSALSRICGQVKQVFVDDLNADGIADLAFSNTGVLNAPNEAFSIMLGDDLSRWSITETQLARILIGTGDLDGDGDIDVLYRDGVGVNDGTGSMTFQATAATNRDRVVIADFTGSGQLDIVVLNGLQFLANQGTWTFVDETAQRVPVTGNYAAGIATDFDGDSDLDLFCVGISGQLLILNQNGIFVAAPPGSLPTGTSNAMQVAAGDLDGDGDVDIVLGGPSQPPRIYQNQGAATFVDASAQLALPALDVWAIAVGDTDGDADLDIVFGELTGGRLMRNQGGTFAQDPAAFDARGFATTALALADLDGDGDSDLVQGCSQVNFGIPAPLGFDGIEPKVLWNDGNGTFQDPTRNDLPARSIDAFAAIGDLDGDDVPDIVLASGTGHVLRNTGDAEFESIPVNLPAPGRPLLGDLDQDGQLDCVLLERNGQFWSLRNVGGTLTAWQGPYQVPLSNGALAVDGELGDINGDGLLDLVVATGGVLQPFPPQPSSADAVWLGIGNGAFQNSPGWFTQTTVLQDIALGDMDGDGDLDAVANGILFRNMGSTFATTPYTTPFGGGYATIALADLDGDGDLDVVTGNRCASGFTCPPPFDEPSNSLHFNDGTGGLNTWFELTGTEFTETWCVAAGDLDGDGDADAIFGNNSTRNGDYNQAVFNNGATWEQSSGRILADVDNTRQILLADLDRDGDLDVLALNLSRDTSQTPRSKIYRNMTRQLVADSPPRIGRDYQLQAHGATLGAALWLAGQPANTPAPPLGILGLGIDRAPFALLSPPAGTVAQITVTLPNLSTLAGTRFYMQAIDIASLRLSNTLAEQFVAW